MHLFHLTGSSPIQKYQKKKKEKRKKWYGYIEKKSKSLKNENKRSKYRKKKKGEQEEVKQILNETLFEDPCWNNPHITCLGLYYHLLPYP